MTRRPIKPSISKKGLRKKRQDDRAGRRAEFLSAWALRLKGYRIIARNWRCRSGEIDIIAQRRAVLVFVEVKYRQDINAAKQAVMGRQMQRINAAAARFVAAQPRLYRARWRFDIMACAPRHWPKHIEDVWRAG